MPRERAKKSNIAIWKIDRTLDVFSAKNTDENLDFIKSSYKKGGLKNVALNSDTYQEKKIRVLRTERVSEGWATFLKDILPEDLSEEKKREVFFSANKDLVFFIYDENDIFAITSGAGYFIIQSYIDERFPFEVAKRMMTGNFKSAEIRDLTGLVYSQSRNFRRDYSFSRRESFGKVWKKLTGTMDATLLKDSHYISDFTTAGSKKKSNADIKSSFTFRKSITIEQVFNLVKEIQVILKREPTEEQKKIFNFLDTLKEVTSKKVKEELRDALIEHIYSFITDKSKSEFDFDFCHPKEVAAFLYGNTYKICEGLEWADSPSATEVLLKIRDSSKIDKTTSENFKKSFLKHSMTFKITDDEDLTFSDNLWKYFHGEIQFGKNKYFLIDGKWYQVVGDFLKRLSEDFIEEIFSSSAPIINLPLIDWKAENEGKYNILQAKEKDFYMGDKVFLKKSEKGNIELFDHLFVKDNKVFLIQVKDGFNASIRDACSQIQMSAEIIENNITSKNYSELKAYYFEFSKVNKDISEKTFLELLAGEKSDRTYILAFAHKEDFSKENFIAGKFQSEIAKFEVLGLVQAFRASGWKFGIAPIKKVSLIT